MPNFLAKTPITMPSKIFLDTNVLIYHTFRKFDVAKHEAAKRMFEDLLERDFTFYVSSQILREFYATATNPKFFDQPLTVDEAILKLDEFEENFVIVNDNCLDELKILAKKHAVVRQKIHDTNIVATMMHHDIKILATFNARDFQRFEAIDLYEL